MSTAQGKEVPDFHPEPVKSETEEWIGVIQRIGSERRKDAPSPLVGEPEQENGNMTDSNGMLPEDYATPSAPSNKTGDLLKHLLEAEARLSDDITDGSMPLVKIRLVIAAIRAARQQTQST